MAPPSLALIPHLFLAATLALAASIDWPLRWILSGAPILTYSWLLGAAKGYRVLPFIPLWTLVATLNLTYAVANTSWLLYWVFFASCYPVIFLSCLFQFDAVAALVRGPLRSLLRQLHFIDDKIAFFSLPALEIDTEASGLMVVRGLTFSLSTLTIVVHGVEVAIKLSADIELAIRTDDVVISLLRKIDIGNVYGNVKGGQYEMTFGKREEKPQDADGDARMVSHPQLHQAPATSPGSLPGKNVKMTEEMTDGAAPKQVSAKDVWKSAKFLSLTDQQAMDNYQDGLRQIKDTSPIMACHRAAVIELETGEETEEGAASRRGRGNDILATVCSMLQDKPPITQPPERSIKVTTLQNLAPVAVRRFLHRLPLLYRLLLNPLSYFHPVNIASITASAPGAWTLHMLNDSVFQNDGELSTDTKHLQERISSWLLDANLVVGLNAMSAWAQVPLLPTVNISNRMIFKDAMLYRNSHDEQELKQIIRTGGADASIEIPLFLFPHHEHLLPPRPTRVTEKDQEAVLDVAEGKPNLIQAQNELDQIRNDEANMTVSMHLHLPFVVDQEVLDFAAALLKASKIVEMEKNPSAFHDEVHSFKEFSKAVGSSLRDNMRKTTADVVVNDKWIARLVGKITRRLETARGDVGYSGDFSIPLKPYRDQAEKASKLLP